MRSFWLPLAVDKLRRRAGKLAQVAQGVRAGLPRTLGERPPAWSRPAPAAKSLPASLPRLAGQAHRRWVARLAAAGQRGPGPSRATVSRRQLMIALHRQLAAVA